jgi:protein-disulfide isomerase
MNYRIVTPYIILLGFFGFLAFAYVNYSQDKANKDLENISTNNVSLVEDTVKRVIKDHPELLIESLEGYQVKKMREAMEEASNKVKANLDKVYGSPDDPRVGSPNAKIKIVELLDYNCGYCKRMAATKAKIIEENPDIEYIFKEFPILGEESILAAKAALAVYDINKDKYKDFHLALLNSNVRKDVDSLASIAGKVGVDVKAFKQALQNAKYSQIIQANHTLARELGLRGTPLYIFNGELLSSGVTYDTLTEKIKEARNSLTSTETEQAEVTTN